MAGVPRRHKVNSLGWQTVKRCPAEEVESTEASAENGVVSGRGARLETRDVGVNIKVLY